MKPYDPLSEPTLQKAVAAFERIWYLQAARLECKRRSANNRSHWRARGSQ